MSTTISIPSSLPRGRLPRKGKSASSEQRKDMKLFNKLAAPDHVTVVRLIQTNFAVQTNVGGTLSATSIAGSNQVQSSCPDFAQYAGLYVQYRVRAMKVTLSPCFVVNTTTVTVPASVAVGEFRGGLGGATYSSLRQSPSGRILSGYKRYVVSCDWDGDIDAHLWSPTTAAITTAESFGLTIAGMATPSTANTYVYSCDVEYAVEFRNTY